MQINNRYRGVKSESHLFQIFMEQYIGMTSQIWGLKKLFSIVSGYRSQMWIFTYRTKWSSIEQISIAFSSRGKVSELCLSCVSVCSSSTVFFSRIAYCIFIPSCKMVSLCCLCGGKKHKHGDAPEGKQVLTRPNLTHCENTFIIHL